MDTLFQMTSFSWPEALGYTLLHSLWQGLVIASIVIVALRFIPSRFSNVRYIVASVGMLTVLMSAIVTFVYLYHSSSSTAAEPQAISFKVVTEPEAYAIAEKWSVLQQINHYVESNIPALLTCWVIGIVFFMLQLAGSWWYVNKIKREAILLDGYWSERVSALASQLNINRIVQLAESHALHSPAVVGYIKPVVLIPVGMLSGLTTEQLEAIFIHELSHIKRHDYLINLFQSIVEALFFFNPFTWLLSNIIRREREHCCDDAVIQHTQNTKAYVYALAQLEEERLSKAGLVLSLASHKTELLNRIKRIMEKSVKQYTSREKIIPALLVIVGLLCASWLTLRADKKPELSFQEDNAVVQDTTKKKNKQKSASYSRKKIITTGPDGKPHEEVVENFEGDESLRPLLANPDFNFDMDFDHLVPPIPDFEGMIPPMPPMGHFNFDMDSTGGPWTLFKHYGNWENFSEEFEKKFRENFDDFHHKHQGELRNMMKELEKNMQHNFNHEWIEEMEKSAREHEEHAREHSNSMHFNEDQWKRFGDQLQQFEEKMKRFDEGQLKNMENNLKSIEENLQNFHKELKDELLKDGYLKKGEKINLFSSDEDGSLMINNKKIKDSHQEKYKQLYQKYFKGKGNFRYVE